MDARYAAPPDQSERIAALEAALKQARVALEWARDDIGHVRSSVVMQALRAIDEVR